MYMTIEAVNPIWLRGALYAPHSHVSCEIELAKKFIASGNAKLPSKANDLVENQNEKSLEEMTKDELVNYAKKNQITIDSNAKKEVVLKVIKDDEQNE